MDLEPDIEELVKRGVLKLSIRQFPLRTAAGHFEMDIDIYLSGKFYRRKVLSFEAAPVHTIASRWRQVRKWFRFK